MKLNLESNFRHEKYTERGLEPEIKISPNIYFYDKDNLIVYVYLKCMLQKIKKRFVADVYIGFKNFQDLLTISSQMQKRKN